MSERTAYDAIDRYDSTTYYLCGPTAMYDFCLDALQRLDVARRRVRYEANGPPTEPQRLPDWPSQLSPATTITVSINGRDKFTAPCGEPLLNSLERAGYQLEVGCRSGLARRRPGWAHR
jgi:ferredoxin-NADP reductase